MNKISRIWTAGIAYVALTVGAGLSIMYNVLETIAVRAQALGWADIVTAVAMPGVVVLMVEMFVSRWWLGRPWQMQIIRWMATLGIGGVAMRASWTHGHAWMLAHGQTEDVAVAWPLAIDCLAIVATALILAGRRTGQLAKDVATVSLDNGQARFTPLANEAVAKLAGQTGQSWPPGQPTDGNLAKDLDDWDKGMDLAIGQAGQELASDTERWLATGQARSVPVVQGEVAVPEEARLAILAWLATPVTERPRPGQVDEILAAVHGVSPRTARRMRDQVKQDQQQEQTQGE